MLDQYRSFHHQFPPVQTTMKTQTLSSLYKQVKSIIKHKTSKKTKTNLNSSISKRTAKRKCQRSINAQLCLLQQQINDLKSIKTKVIQEVDNSGPDFKIYECGDDFAHSYSPIHTKSINNNKNFSLKKNPQIQRIQQLQLPSSASYINIYKSPCPPPLPPKNQRLQPPPLVTRKCLTYC